MRGAMNFDDYNYSSINKHVLIGNSNSNEDNYNPAAR